jgi:hypothetical protein
MPCVEGTGLSARGLTTGISDRYPGIFTGQLKDISIFMSSLLGCSVSLKRNPTAAGGMVTEPSPSYRGAFYLLV